MIENISTCEAEWMLMRHLAMLDHENGGCFRHIHIYTQDDDDAEITSAWIAKPV